MNDEMGLHPSNKIPEEQLRHAPDGGCNLLSRLIAIWQQRPEFRSHRPSLHDPLVVATLCAPQLFRLERLRARSPGDPSQASRSRASWRGQRFGRR